ncbi:hypothetical protein ACETU7_24825 [Rhodococcus sp. 3Y1]
MAETVTVLTPGISSVQDLGRGSASQFGQATAAQPTRSARRSPTRWWVVGARPRYWS